MFLLLVLLLLSDYSSSRNNKYFDGPCLFRCALVVFLFLFAHREILFIAAPVEAREISHEFSLD